jgi:hypothetical protein
MALTNEVAKSTPDISKLGGMTNRTVLVTRHTTKNGAGQLVLPAWKSVTVDQINDLHTSLPAKFGPGTYRFEVFDDGGPDRDVWTVKLGPDVPEPASSPPPFFAHNLGMMGGAPAPSAGAGDHGSNSMGMSIDLGNGWYYVPMLGSVITPQRQMIPWKPQDGQLPGGGGGSFGFGGAAPAPATAAPVASAFPPWGSYPVEDSSKRQVEALQEQLRAEREARLEQERRREATDTRASFEKIIAENNARFETLIAKLTEKPAGDEALKQQLLDMQRRMEEQKREADLRLEMRQQQERFESAMRDLSENRADPHLSMLTQIMTNGQNANSEAVKAMRDSSTAQATSAERQAHLVAERLSGSIMTPLQIVDLMRMAKDQSSNNEINKSMVDMFQNLFGMAKGLVRDQAEMLNQGSGPAWLPVAQQGIDALGRVAQMYATSKARAEAQVEHERRAAVRRPAAPPVVRVTQPPPAAPSRIAAQPPSAASERDQIAARVFRTSGDKTPSVTARDEAAAAVFGPGASTTAQNVGTPPQPRVVQPRVVQPRVVQPQVVQSKARKPRKPPVEDLRNVPTADLQTLTDQIPDEEFFGPAIEKVLELREYVNVGALTPSDIVGFVFEARQQLLAFGAFPPCVELLQVGKAEIVTARLLPAADEAFRAEVVEGILAQLSAEESGEVGAEEQPEGDA